jgi:hypothetical protein
MVHMENERVKHGFVFMFKVKSKEPKTQSTLTHRI